MAKKYDPVQLYNKKNYEDLVRDILIDFSCVFDTDLAVIIYMMRHYAKSKYFIPEAKEWTMYFTKCKVRTREKINPLTILLKEEYMDQADNLYDEILSDHWAEVLKESKQTEVFNIVYGTFEYTGYNITVNCRNEQEVEYIKKHLSKWSTEMHQQIIDKYFCIFMYDLDTDLKTMKPMVGKCIYIYYHKPNFLNYKLKVPNVTLAPFSLYNDFRIIDPDSNLVLPYDMTESDLEVNEHGKEYRAK